MNDVINQCEQDYYLKMLKSKSEDTQLFLFTESPPVSNIQNHYIEAVKT